MVPAPVNAIRLLLSDVDGTLVTPDKMLTSQTVDAVGQLRDAGILVAIASARPAQGLTMFVEPLGLTTPLAALNGGLIVDEDLRVLRRHDIAADLVPSIIETLRARGLSVWLYRGLDWFVLDQNGPHVAHEARSCRFAPTQLASFDGVADDVTKVVGVSDDHVANRDALAALHDDFGPRIIATPSQSYYLDVTHPRATKGDVVRFVAERYAIAPDAIATIGDMPNDVSMFAASGLSIAMGNADLAVQRAADYVTSANDEEGFANAVRSFILST